MRIKVKLFATLRQGRDKVMDIDIAEGSNVRSILELLDIRQTEVAILLINGRDGLLDAKLVDNDTVSIFPPVGGG